MRMMPLGLGAPYGRGPHLVFLRLPNTWPGTGTYVTDKGFRIESRG